MESSIFHHYIFYDRNLHYGNEMIIHVTIIFQIQQIFVIDNLFAHTSIIYSVSKICYFIPYHTMKIYSNILTNYYGCTQKVNMLWTTMFGRKIHLNETIVGYISRSQYYKNRNLINHHVLKRCQICSKTLIDIIFLLYRASYDQYSPSRYHV